MVMLKYLVIGMLATPVLLAGCAKGGGQTVEVRNGKVTNVEVFPAKTGVFTEYITLPVAVNPWREANIGLIQGGRVDKIEVDKGSRVRAGQLLLSTDTETLRANLRIAEANLEYQKSEFGRNSKLHETGSVSDAVFDAAKLQLAQAQSAFEIAGKQLEDATLEAPFDGVITERLVEAGNILGPGAPAFRLIDISRVRVRAGIPEKFIGDFRAGANVTIMFDAIPGRDFKGRINYLAPEADTATRTFMAEIVVDNSGALIRSGIMGNARIQRKILDNALIVPLDALIETQEGRKLFVAVQDTLASERAVTIGSSSGEMIMVTSGIEEGDKVITKGQHFLADGERVKITGEYHATAAGEVSAQ